MSLKLRLCELVVGELHLDIERKILSYLRKYGNTKESDLLDYATAKLGCRREEIKKGLDRLRVKGKIQYIVHSSLEPPQAYIGSAEPWFPEGVMSFIEEGEELTKATDAILREAADLAEKRLRKGFPDD